MKRSKKTPEPAETSETRSTRREILRGGLLIAGAAAVARVATGGAKPAHAADGQPLLIGQVNDGNSPTTLSTPGALRALTVTSLAIDPNQPGTVDGFASTLLGESSVGVGVEGRSIDGAGVVGHVGNAIVATDPNMEDPYPYAGVFGAGADALGVVGRSSSNTGVLGQTGSFTTDPNEVPTFAGVHGIAGVPDDPNSVLSLAGLFGYASDPNSPAVLARSSSIDAGVALSVQGRAVFSSAGSDTIPAGIDRVTVNHLSVSPSSVVLVTLASDPVGGRRLKFVTTGDRMFTVVLSSKAKVPVTFNYLVVN